MIDKKDLLELEADGIKDELAALGEKPYRAQQIWKWLYAGELDFRAMSNLPLGLRETLSERYRAGGLRIRNKLTSRVDGTRKYLFELDDGNIIEGVLMQYHYGYSACLSTQVGCKMGCSFCASSPLGFVRNLTIGEMLGELLLITHDIGDRISHVVLMGIGEPFDNYENVVGFLRRINREDTLNISFRKMTVSTCGIVPGILRFAREGFPVNLSVSLHAPNDEIRARIMPIARRWPMEELLTACNEYARITSRRVTYEYALIRGVNDSVRHAEELAERIKNTLCHVNLIPVNKVEGTGFDRSSRERVEAFRKALERKGIAVTVRRELGSDIMAACGQLRRDTLQKLGKV
jgi:23S rRNA m(2)A-2503 methyltransferase (EC 2.1.1.-)